MESSNKKINKTNPKPKSKSNVKKSNNNKSKVTKNKPNKEEKKFNIKSIITKERVIYMIILISDFALLIYAARQNIINYISVDNKTFYLGKKTNLFFGRNYITLVVTTIVYLYLIVINKFWFNKKINIKYLILSLLILLIINSLVFYLFTIKVY